MQWRLESSGMWHCTVQQVDPSGSNIVQGTTDSAKHEELLTQQHTVTSQETLIFNTSIGRIQTSQCKMNLLFSNCNCSLKVDT
jgi:hypothetical protein